MLDRYGRFIVRRRWAVLSVVTVGLLLSVAALIRLPDALKTEAFVAPGTEAYEGKRILDREFDIAVPNLLLVVTAKSGSVDAAAVVAEANATVERLAAEGDVDEVASYWTLGRAPSLRNESGSRALVIGRIRGTEEEADRRIRELRPRYHQRSAVIDVRVGGTADFYREYADLVEKEIRRSEFFTGPLILLALLVVFGSAVAACLPLAMAAIAVLGTSAVLFAITRFASVSVFAMSLTTILGLGLGLDYSLFVVSRFREELSAGHEPGDAVVRTMRTAGRTVLYSAGAVAIALIALVLSPLNLVRSLGYSGIATAAMAGVGALVVLPALLAALGTNVNRCTVWTRSIRPADGTGVWHRMAVIVMRRPLLVAGAVIAVLLVCAVPVLHLNPGLVDDRDLPPWSNSRTIGDILRREFGGREGTPIRVVLPWVAADQSAGEVDAFAATLAALPAVTRVEAATGSYSGVSRAALPDEGAQRFVGDRSTYLNVISRIEPISREGERLIDAIRALPAPFESVLVTGEAANAFDVKNAILRTMPPAMLLIGIATFVALFLQFGSLLVPIKAIVLNVLSISALFGVMVWIFQDGHLAGLLGITATGSFYVNLPILIFCLAFGLSMDYEVFLLSRIKEEYDRTGDNEASVAMGLERSGRIVSAAAMLIAVVFLTTAALGYTMFSKALGTGLGLVVLLDAFIVRGTLVPAVMKMAGAANWWAPGPLRRLHDRFGFSERVELDVREDPLSGGHEVGVQNDGSPAAVTLSASPCPPTTEGDTDR